MNYEDRYNEALKIARDNYNVVDSANINVNSFKNTLTTIFPELKEKTDKEMIQKLISVVHLYYGEGVDAEKDECLKWLEKQIIKPYSRTSFEYNNHTWGICARDNGIDIFYDSNLIKHIEQPQDKTALDNQSEQKQEWSKVDENEFNHILKILNLVAEEQETKGYNNLISSVNWLKSIKDRIQSKPRKKNIEQNLAKKYGITGIGSKHAEGKLGEMIKKKIETENVDNTNKVEPKFKVGDWVVRKDGGVFFNDRKFAQITEIDGEKHWFDTGLISLKAEDMRLWRLEDAKDGDILYSKKHNLLWRYKNTKECYFCMNLNYNSNNISKGDAIVIPNDVKPATKEQRDLLLDKILQQGQHNPIENANIENANNDISNDMSNDMPNLKVGDWVIREDGKPFRNGNKFAQIKSIKFDGNMCFLDTGRWLYSSEIRAWSIYDAKPGDVLVASDGSIFIFAGVVDYACNYYVALTLYNGLSINKEVKGGYWETSRAVHPATKEQCDLLFAKMREKGYKYNNEKKEIIRRI